jgi:hypothetical protein
MRERLLAELDARIARHDAGDSSGVLDDSALGLVAEVARTGPPDAGSLARVAALHLCRYRAMPPDHAGTDLELARAVYTNLHTVDPRLVPEDVRELLGLASPHDGGVARLREYERTGHPDHLERAISLFRQEVVEHRGATGMRCLAEALRRRYERTGQQADLDEAISLTRR